MKNIILILVLFLLETSIVLGQNSSLVYPGSNGKLVYEKYANWGEDTLVNIIPDFSFAGYMKGGVPLPLDIPVKITLDPTGMEDDRVMIQDAIDEVSALMPDENGFRGAVLLKKGLYKINGSLNINTSGVLLKGEGQLSVEDGGTELVATANYQHSFINITGMVEQDTSLIIDIGTDLASFDFPVIDTWIVEEVTQGVSAELNNDSVITFMFYSIESGNFKFYSKEEEDSTKIPFLEVIYYSETTSANDTIIIYPTDDTYVRGLEEYRDSVLGHETKVYYKKLDPELARIGYIKFPLDSVAGAIKSARLNVMAAREDQIGTNYISYVQDDNWSEDTRTWNNTFANVNNPVRISSQYVGTGSKSFVIEDASSFAIGDEIFVRRTPNQLWCDTLKMSTLSEIDPEATDWTPDSYIIDHPRIITDIQGNTVTVDIPVIDPMRELYGGGYILHKLYNVSLQQSGVENMFITSVYASETDEEHGWTAIETSNAENCWVKNVTARYFGYACVDLEENSSYFTIQDCALLDPKSITDGGRKYPFPIHGGIGNLVQRCYARGGRHSFATHSRLTGPHIFLDCYATETYADIGPHHRWAAGILYDNVYGGQIRVQNRWDMGSGHGWAGVQNMFWNCHSYMEEFKVESPFGGMNWGIGCTAQVKEGDGFWESYGTPVITRSLYIQQLEDRLGYEAVLNITTQEQRNGRIWDNLASWIGSTTGVREKEMTNINIKFYPNPVKEQLNIDLTELQYNEVSVIVYNVLGECIYSGQIPSGTISQINLPKSLNKEFLIIKLKTGDKNLAHSKIIIH